MRACTFRHTLGGASKAEAHGRLSQRSFQRSFQRRMTSRAQPKSHSPWQVGMGDWMLGGGGAPSWPHSVLEFPKAAILWPFGGFVGTPLSQRPKQPATIHHKEGWGLPTQVAHLVW